MRHENGLTGVSAARVTATLFGVLAGIGGMTHGVGEVLQGNVAPEGIAINSWTQGPIATNMGGEPGITLVPNLFVTGLLTIFAAIAMVAWATLFVERKHGGRIVIALSVFMLLVGGGIGPPIIGILAGVAGTWIDTPLTGWRSRLPANVARVLGSLWPWLFAVAAASGSFLVVGSLILVFFFDLDNAGLFLSFFYLTVLTLLLTVLTAPLFDGQKGERGAAVLT